jgi:uncharacterized protein (TIGR00369 family)
MEHVARWIEKSEYARALGVEIEALAGDAVRLRLPFREANTNPGQVLHGGVAASLIAIAGGAVARATLGPAAAPFHTPAIQVTYLAAAKAEAVLARARRLRAGKELCFVDVAIATPEEKPIAHGLLVARGRFGAAPAETARAAGDDGAAEPGPLAPHIERAPFMAGLGLRIEHMTGGRSRIRLPWRAANADADGCSHEGAVLALLDTTGAMAAWAVTGPGPFKASTPALQARILAPAPPQELVAFGRCGQRDGEAFVSDVEVAASATGRVCARGTVLYRIVQ